MAEQFSNNARTTLADAITAGATTLTVASAAGFPAAASYRILIDSEILIVTGGAGTATWTVTRGAEGTVAAAHAAGAIVSHVLTAGALAAISLPAVGAAGDVLTTVNGAWAPAVPAAGGSGPAPTATLAEYTWVNQGSAVAADSSAGLFLRAGLTTGIAYRMLVKALPAPPYTAVYRFRPNMWGIANAFAGAVLRNSSTGALILMKMMVESNVSYLRFASATGPTAAPTNILAASYFLWQPAHFRIRDDGTNRDYSISPDGVNWLPPYVSHARATVTVPDQIGVFVNAGSTAYDTGLTLESLAVT